jgi:hypothetical protein
MRILYGLTLFAAVASAEIESGSEHQYLRRTNDLESAEREWAEVEAASRADEDAAEREELTKVALHKQGLYTAKADPVHPKKKHKKGSHCDDTVESIGILGTAFLWVAAAAFFFVCNIFFGILASPPHFKGKLGQSAPPPPLPPPHPTPPY